MSFWGRSSSPGRLHNVQTGSGAHPAFYPKCTKGSFWGVKRQGREVGSLPPTSAEVRKMWMYTTMIGVIQNVRAL
jgi:hypothetical protein